MSTKIKPNKTFIIRHKVTKDNWTASSGKSAWRAPNHAKAAFAQSDHRSDKDLVPLKMKNSYREWFEYPRFDEQDVYELVEVKPESDSKLQEACGLLRECLDETSFLADSNLGRRIIRFVEENYSA